MSAGVGLPEALERAAAALPKLADVIRPANGDPFALLDELPGPDAEGLLRWMLENEPDAGVELALDWAEEPEEGLEPLVALQQGTSQETSMQTPINEFALQCNVARCKVLLLYIHGSPHHRLYKAPMQAPL